MKPRPHRPGLSSIASSDHDVPIWMTVYSDMITNLMMFFLLMFAMNLAGGTHVQKAADALKREWTGEAPTETVPARPDENLDDFLRRLGEQQKDLQVVQQGEGVRLRLPEPVLFEPGSADLKPEAGPVLREIAEGIKKLDNVLVVEGHTDDRPLTRGPYRSNWELSEARAENVINHLARVEGLPPERMAVAGYGEFWPFTPNDSALNRALNRRIELLLIIDENEKAPS